MNYKICYQAAFKKDLKQIVEYLVEQTQDFRKGEELAEEIVEAAESLSEMPYRYPVYTPLRRLKGEYRKFPFHHWYLYYQVDEEKKTITVSRIVHARRKLYRIDEN